MSVVMLSATRPDNAKFITEVLSLHTKIASIIVVHALERSAQNLEPISPKVVDVHAHADAGLNRLQQIYRGGQRFFYANAAKCDSILFLDDDMLPTPAAISRLAAKVKEDPLNIYGFFPRRCTRDEIVDAIPPTKGNTILTGFAATSKRVVESFVQSFCDSYEPVLRNTNGNGEDLIFNSFVRRRFGAVPTLVKGEGYKALESPTLEVQEGQHGEEGFDRVRQSLCTWMCSRENCTLHDQRERGWMGS